MTSCEFDCEGCGVHVFAVGRDAAPAHGFCAVCAWLCEFETPEQIMERRRQCEPGGWVSERTIRRQKP